MFLVGVTGGIGSGKSTVTARLAALGCPVVDADLVAREVVAPGEPTLRDLADHFGGDVVRADGTLDRPLLAARAFADDEARAALDRITHPRIAARIAERIATLGAEHRGDGPLLVVVDHPLLLETGQAGRFDAVVVVLADEEQRVRRLVARGMDEADARARMRVQVDDAARRAAATHVVHNDAGIEELEASVDALHTELLVSATAEA